MKLIILQFQIDGRPKAMVPETSFKAYCPGQYKRVPHKLMMYNNGSVSNNARYQNLCVERFAISVAYNHDPWIFEIENNSMIDLKEKYGRIVIYWRGYVSQTDEILSEFFLNYNILTTWIDCNYTWGWFDHETEKWTGAVGKVYID